MIEEFGYEVTPQQSLDTLHKIGKDYDERHGISDISLHIEGTEYELRYHLRKYEEYKIKAEAYDELTKLEDEWADECMDYIDSLNESGGEIDESVLKDFDNEFTYERAMLSDRVYLSLKELKKKEG